MEITKNSKIFLATKQDIMAGITKAIADYKVAALTKKTGRFLYDYIDDGAEITFEYAPTVLPPKKFFFPQDEVIVEYKKDTSEEITVKAEGFPQVLFGIRPCDLNGLKLLDEAFADGYLDPNYFAKREQALIIGMDCNKLCDKDSFCYKVEAHEAANCFDIMCYPRNDGFVINAVTPKGIAFIEKYFALQTGSLTAIEDFKKDKAKNFADKKPFAKLAEFPELFEASGEHAIWEQEAKRCLSCGSCVMTCPTCYCFDIVDEMQLNMKGGERIRKWDSCMLDSFAIIAGEENMRPMTVGRLKHRINRKFNYLMRKHGRAVCVGCGRCVRACLAKISPKTIAEAIQDEK